MRKSSGRRQKTRMSCLVESENHTDTTAQHFQITVNVMEAKKLAWNNSQTPTSYVVIVLGKKKHRTNIRQNIAEPCYRECFVFEMYTTIQELQHSNVWLAVMEPRCCAPPQLLGEANINLGAIWAQPSHTISHKWAQLTLPQDPAAGLAGFLKVDISILIRDEAQNMQIMPLLINENHLENDILLPSGMEQTRANYMVIVYGGFALPSGPNSYGERRYGKPPNTFVRVSFCGLTAKTSIQTRNSYPTYNEQVSIVEMFPNACQKIRLEVCSTEGYITRVLASTHLRLDLVSHDGDNGFIPTFGPSLLHMYGNCPGSVSHTSEDGPCHRGALLVALKTIVPFHHQVRSTSVEPALPIKTNNLWLLEDFCVFCPILEVSMLDRRIAGKSCGVAITIGEIFSVIKGNDEFPAMVNEIKSRKLHYTGPMDVVKMPPVYGYVDFPHGFPVLQLSTRLPDIRFRMYRNNMVHGIVSNLETALTDLERRLNTFEYAFLSDLLDDLNKAVDDTLGNILKFLDIVQYSCPSSSSDNVMQQCSTELDQRQLTLQKDEIDKLYKKLSARAKTNSFMSLGVPVSRTDDGGVITRKTVKVLLAEAKGLMENLKNLIFKSPVGWPDVVVWLLNAGSRVAYCKISPADITYSVIQEQNGRNCGRIQTIYMKPLKCPKHPTGVLSACGCIAGKVEVIMWMGLYRQHMAFDKCLPIGYHLRMREYDMALKSSTVMMLECRCFLYRAKLYNLMENNYAYSFARMHALCSVTETKLKQKTPTPVWNQVLKIRKMVFCTQDRLYSYPPSVLIEIYGSELSGKCELLGRLQVEPTVEDRQGFEYVPKLQWHDVKLGEECIGQVLTSVQILQIPEKLMKTTVYSPIEESFYAEDLKEFCDKDGIIPLPSNLIPQSTTYKVDIYWWGLRDVNMTRKPCVALETDELTVKSDIISVTKPNCNFRNSLMSQVFEAPLNEPCCSPLNIKLYDSNSFGRTSFLGVHVIKNPNKYLINWIALSERGSLVKTASITSSNFVQVTPTLCIMKRQPSQNETKSSPSLRNIKSTAKISKLRRIFGKKVPDEEEYVLLPMFSKDKVQNKVLNRKPSQHRDWWSRYFDAVEIYGSELESQPEFSKFKDWCTTFKFYNGIKSGIPEKDDQRYCGSLKAGFAIYKWPLPERTVAVSLSGVDLTNGYFADHPCNDVNKFLVRVYIAKGSNLAASDFSGKSDAYVMVNCGKTVLGDRINYVPNTTNPTFGKFFEFRCTIPDEYLLTVSLFDYETVVPDELIGKTTIDLENRIYTKHRARVGLATEYNLTGTSKWRDPQKPSQILEELCKKNYIAAPTYPDFGTVVVNGVEYKDIDKEMDNLSSFGSKEKICLNILHKWYTLPLCGYHLVPEHVETRTLYNPDKPGVNQGQLQMWVDIFPLGNGVNIPRPVDITPKVEEYELRVIIWGVSGVNLDNNNLLKSRADICVTGWIGCADQSQSTDVYCVSEKGEASFNWRLIFNFSYQRAENMVIFKEKGPFIEFEERLPPVLVLQITECDELSPNHCFGSLHLNLNTLSPALNNAQDCILPKMKYTKKINLFGTGSIRGWWPLESIDTGTGSHLIAGAIELEMMLLPKEKAVLMPVGLGRGPPSPLPEPKCQEISCELLSRYISSTSPKRLKLFLIIAVAMIVILLVNYLEVPIISLEYWFSDDDLLTDRHIKGLCKL